MFGAKAHLLLPDLGGIFQYESSLSDGWQVYKTNAGATARIKEEPNRVMVGKVEVGQRSFVIDSTLPKVWGESIDCEVSPWSEWSTCSKPCDFGQSQRSRSVTKEARRGGSVCPIPLNATKACNTFPCSKFLLIFDSTANQIIVQLVPMGKLVMGSVASKTRTETDFPTDSLMERALFLARWRLKKFSILDE